MNGYGKIIRELLEQNDCYFVRHGNGDHDIWYSPIMNRNIPVPVKIDSRHTANSILKQAGIDYHF